MQILKVQLRDLRSYHEAEIAFEPGVNAIVGSNGAGKSTVLSAIGLALFNTRPPSSKADELVREGAKTAEIVVDFESALDGRCYQVERHLGGSNRYRIYDPELGRAVLAEGVSDCEDWLRTHLGVSAGLSLSDLFEHTIGVFQGTFTAPFLMTPAVRKPIFDPLLRVDEYQRAVQLLLEPRRTLGEQDHVAEVRLAAISGQLLALPDLQRQAEALTERIAATEVALAQTRVALGEARACCEAFDGLRAGLAAAEQTRNGLAAEVRTQQASLAAAQDALSRAEMAAQRALVATPGHERYLAAEEQRTGLDQERHQRDGLQARLARLEAQLAASVAQEGGYRQQLANLEGVAQRAAQLEPLAAQQAELELALNAAREAASHLQQARKTVADLTGRLAQQDDRVVKLTAELAEREQVTAQQATAQAAAERLQQEAEQRQLRRGECLATQGQLTKQLDDLRDAAGGLCPVCEAPLTPAHRAELVQRNEAELAALAEQVATLDREQAQADQERRAVQRQLKDCSQRLATLSGAAQLADVAQTQVALQGQLAAARVQVAALGDPASEVQRVQGELTALDNPAQALATARHELARRPGIEAALGKTMTDQAALAAEQAAQQAALARYADLDQRLAAMTVALDTHRAAHNDYLTNQNEAAQLPARRGRAAALSADLAVLALRLAEAESAWQVAREQYDADADQQAQQARLSLEGEAAGRAATLIADQESLAQTRHRMAALETLGVEQAALQATRGKIAAAVRLIDWTRDLLRAAGPYVTRQLVRRISLEAATLFSELMDNYAARLQWSETYELTLEVSGQQRGFAQLSGGEQMCAALALRLALLRNLTGIDLAFFDEPTAHLDGERRALLAHTLTQVQGFGQIFVISHDSTFEQAAQAYFVVTKDGDGSHIERL